MMSNLGHGRYQPEVSAFFPKLGRGHSQGFGTQTCIACRTGDVKNHSSQGKNREDWEESVGIRRASRTTRRASSGMRTATSVAADPKGLTTAG